MLKKVFSLAALISIMLAAVSIGPSCSVAKTPEQAYQDSIARVAAQRMMEQGDFVLVADRITFGRGGMRNVTPNTNFVVVKGDEAVIQASPAIGGGPNGVGGVTISGKITSYRVETAKNGRTTAKFHVSATVGSSDVTVTLEKDYNGATAYVSGDFTGRNLTLSGKLQSTAAANYFEGRSR